MQNVPERNSKVQISFSKEEKIELEEYVNYYYGMSLTTWLRSNAIKELRQSQESGQLQPATQALVDQVVNGSEPMIETTPNDFMNDLRS